MSIDRAVRGWGTVRVTLLVAFLSALLVATNAGYLAPPARAAVCAETNPVLQKYCEMGGLNSILGAPRSAPYYPAGGIAQDYENGSIFWSAATGAHEVHGVIATRYRQLSGPTGLLGFPTTDQRRTADAIGAYNHFQKGSIFWSPSTGAWEVRGLLRDRWAALGWERGVLGYPTGGTTAVSDGIGRFNNFQGGAIYWSPSTGTWEVRGLLLQRWTALGGPRGLLGYPVTGTRSVSDGIGRYNDFQGGSVYWSPSTGAWEVRGSIRDKWIAVGGPRGILGYPVTGTRVAGDSVGRYNHFQTGSVFYSPATGTHEVHGVIWDRWAASGYERGPLGYPITDEYAVNGGRQSDFQRGFLRLTTATGSVRQAILTPYQRAGTWVTRYRFSREFAGSNPPITPATVDAMAAAGVHTLYIQAAADDARYPGLLSPDLLGAFLTRAHARGMRVVAWYLPHLTDVNADMRRLQAMIDFRASGQAFDGIGLDIEDLSVTDVATRNARLVDLSARLFAAAPDMTLSAIVLPPVVTDVLNTAYWPNFPWRQLAGYYQVWMPMAYWSNRTDPYYSDPWRYTAENISRTRQNLGESCAAVSVIGGYGLQVSAAAYSAMATAARDRGAVGVSIFDWTTTPAASWPPIRGYNTRGC